MPLTLAAVGDAVPMAGRQVALSRLVAFAIGGQLTGGALAGAFADSLGWRGVLLVCGIAALAGSALLFTGLRDAPPEPTGRFDPIRAFGRYRMILGMPAARQLYWAVAIEGVLVFGCFPWFAPMLAGQGMGGTAEAGLAVALFGGGGVIYAFGARRLLAGLGQRRMVLLGGGMSLLGLWGFALAPAAAGFIAAALVLGLGFYMLHNSIQTRVTEVAPEARGSAVALHAFSFYAGQAAGPILVGEAGLALGFPAALLAAGIGMALLGVWLGRNRG
jgi:predicted MFS family arabinose efflux permease